MRVHLAGPGQLTAGPGAAQLCAAHLSILVEGTAQLFVTGPPVVRKGAGEDVGKEQLGGSRVHARNGAVDLVAASEQEAFGLIRRFLSSRRSSARVRPGRCSATGCVTRTPYCQPAPAGHHVAPGPEVTPSSAPDRPASDRPASDRPPGGRLAPGRERGVGTGPSDTGCEPSRSSSGMRCGARKAVAFRRGSRARH